jgi:phosphoadenosine phosphosulfate reductase
MPNASLAEKGALPRVPPMSANLDTRIRSALGWLECAASHPRPAFSSSFGAEDMVLLDLIVRHALPIDIFTLDTGRLPEETHALMGQVERRYGRVFTVSFPEAQAVSQLVAEQGSNGFYDSVDKRRACCAVRKVQPLQRALAGRGAWVTGQRAAQSATRTGLQAIEPESLPGVLKVNPLHDWSEAEVWAYLRAHEVPVNALHARRFPSIGCAPCTRAITAGEDVRAGRWWWEEPAAKECGLHARAPREGAVHGS